MRVILDNCVNRRLSRLIVGHEVAHAIDLGWDKLSNGRLLSACEDDGWEVLVTVDKNMRFQQNLDKRKITLIVLDLPRIDLDSLRRKLPKLQQALDQSLSPGSLVVIT